MAKLKNCPTCNRTYSDETITFCLVDGAILSAPYDPQATLQIPEPRSTTPPPTQILQPDTSAEKKPLDLHSKQKPPAKLRLIRTAIIGAVIGAVVGAITGPAIDINFHRGLRITQAAVAFALYGLLIGIVALPIFKILFFFMRKK